MQTRLLTMDDVKKKVDRSAPYLRALADTGVIDSFIIGRWRAFPPHAVDQIKKHEAQKAKV